MTQKEMIERGDNLSEKYSEEELKDALRNAVAIDDSQERLCLQWALKKKTDTKDGYAFTKEAKEKLETKLEE